MDNGGRIPNSFHDSHPWVISRIAPDFQLLDAWALPVEGSKDDFDAFVEAIASSDPSKEGSGLVRFLFWVRLRIGALLGWDDADKKRPIPGCTETTLAVRLPDELRDRDATPTTSGAMKRIAGGFVPLYRTDDEWAAEISNETVHGVLHLAWIESADGWCYRAQMGVYVKPRGRWGEIYLKLIAPFRHLIVYPALVRRMKRQWDAMRTESSVGHA